jgi:hypothetical protein
MILLLRSKLAYIICSSASVADFLLSGLLFIETNASLQLLLAGLMLFSTLVTFFTLTKSRDIRRKAIDTLGLQSWLIICSAFTILFIATITIPSSFSLIPPALADFIFVLTISLNGTTCLVFLCFLLEIPLERWSKEQNQRQVEIYLEKRAQTRSRSSFPIEFESITRKLIGPAAPTFPCPHCLSAIDFNEKIEWLGPRAFLCNHCGAIVDLSDLPDLN